MNDNVTQFPKQFPTAKAREFTRDYRGHVVTVKYDKQTKQWSWSFSHQPPSLTFGGLAADPEDAVITAKSQIDDLLEAGGRGGAA